MYFTAFGLIHGFVVEWVSERETGPDEHEKQLKLKETTTESSVREP